LRGLFVCIRRSGVFFPISIYERVYGLKVFYSKGEMIICNKKEAFLPFSTFLLLLPNSSKTKQK